MLTCHPRVPGPPILRLLEIFFLVFCFSIRPTDPISGNAFDAKQKKGEMALCHNIIVKLSVADFNK